MSDSTTKHSRENYHVSFFLSNPFFDSQTGEKTIKCMNFQYTVAVLFTLMAMSLFSPNLNSQTVSSFCRKYNIVILCVPVLIDNGFTSNPYTFDRNVSVLLLRFSFVNKYVPTYIVISSESSEYSIRMGSSKKSVDVKNE